MIQEEKMVSLDSAQEQKNKTLKTKDFFKFCLWSAYVYLISELILCPLVLGIFTAVATLASGALVGTIFGITYYLTGVAEYANGPSQIIPLILVYLGMVVATPILFLIRFELILFWFKARNQSWAPATIFKYFTNRIRQAISEANTEVTEESYTIYNASDLEKSGELSTPQQGEKI